jgi:hypothetical protein
MHKGSVASCSIVHNLELLIPIVPDFVIELIPIIVGNVA